MDTTRVGTEQTVYARSRYAHRPMIRLRSNKGMTLPEVMTTCMIILLMSFTLLYFMYSYNRMRYEFQSRLKMVNDSRISLQKMVWGPRPDAATIRRSMWEATDFNIISATQMSYTDVLGVTHGIRRNGLKIETNVGNGAWTTLYDPNGAAADDATRYSTALSFTATPQPNVVQIRLTLGENIRGGWNYVSASTQVAFRN